MKSTDSLNKFSILIGADASSSDIATIPVTQATAGDGTASIALAFPPETFIAREAGGEPPRGQDMNGLLYLLSSAIQPLQAGYLGAYDADFASGIGGYPAGAIVSGSSVGTFWVSTSDNNTTVPGEDGASWQSLFTGLQAALGFTPVQQGGGTNQTTDKVTIGNISGGTAILSYTINGTDCGPIVSGQYGYAPDSGDYPIFSLHWSGGNGRPLVGYGSDLSAGLTLAPLALYSDIQTVQTNLTAFQTAQATENATLSADISDCVSGVYGKSSADYQMLGLYQQGSTGRPVVVFNNGTTTVYNAIANYADVTTLQTSLAAFQTQQSDQNSTFSSEIAARVPTNATNDGTNAPITLMNYYLGTGLPWFSANGVQYNLAQTNPGTGWNAIKNITVEDDNGALTVLDTTATTNTYAPSSSGTIAASGNITGGYWTKTGSILRQVIFLEKLIDNPVVTFPTAYSAVPCVTFGTSTEYTTQNTAFANIQRDTSDNLLLSATGCTLHISRGAPDVAVSGDGVDVWMTIEGPVSS